MKGSALRLVYRIHAWMGVGFGLVVLALCLTGSIAVLRADIVGWVGSPLPPVSNACRLAPDQALARMSNGLDGDAPVRRLSLPALTGGYYELRLADGRRTALDYCGNGVAPDRAEAGTFLVNLHSRLFLGKSGRWVVGGFGVAMLVSTLTGVLLHRKLVSQLFTLRRGRGARLWLSDAHKLIGVWLLPFHLLIALTGAWLGLYAVLGGAGLDRQASAPRAAAFVVPPSVEAMLAQAHAVMPGIVPVFIDFFPERGHVSVRGNLPGHLVQRHRAEVLFDGSGDVLATRDPRMESGLTRIHGMMMPLHLGDWAGNAVRWLYVFLGLGSTWLVWLGLRLWVDRRERSDGILYKRGRSAMLGLRTAAFGLVGGVLIPLLAGMVKPGAMNLDGQSFLLTLAMTAVLVGPLLLSHWRRRDASSVDQLPQMSKRGERAEPDRDGC